MGYTCRVNLFPNPLFSPDGFRYGAWGANYTKCMAGDGMLDVSKSTENDGLGTFVEIRAKLLTPGVEYVFSAQPEDDAADRLAFWYSKDKSVSVERDGDGRMTVRFTASDYGYQRCFFHNGVWSRPLLESASTFDESLPYFDYATMPRSGGGIRPSPLASPLFFHYQKSGEATTSTLERELKSLLWSRL